MGWVKHGSDHIILAVPAGKVYVKISSVLVPLSARCAWLGKVWSALGQQPYIYQRYILPIADISTHKTVVVPIAFHDFYYSDNLFKKRHHSSEL